MEEINKELPFQNEEKEKPAVINYRQERTCLSK